MQDNSRTSIVYSISWAAQANCPLGPLLGSVGTLQNGIPLKVAKTGSFAIVTGKRNRNNNEAQIYQTFFCCNQDPMFLLLLIEGIRGWGGGGSG